MYPEPASSCLVGISVGTLAAAAIGCTRSLSDLLPVAVQTVVLSFNAGLLASELSERFCTTSDQPGQRWAFVALRLSTAGATDKSHEFSENEVSVIMTAFARLTFRSRFRNCPVHMCQAPWGKVSPYPVRHTFCHFSGDRSG